MLDPFALKTQLQPALLAMFPLLLATLAFFGGDVALPSVLSTAGGAVGLTYLLCVLARNRGKRVEPALWNKWGGTPTVRLLRHRGPGNSVLRERWHRQLASLIGKRLPSPAAELKDPTNADAAYEAATRLLIGRVRDGNQFTFVRRDIIAYNFCRNIYGLKPVGIVFSLVALGVGGFTFFQAIQAEEMLFLPVLYLFAAIICVVFWTLIVNAAWVRIPAINYAQHLFEALEDIIITNVSS